MTVLDFLENILAMCQDREDMLEDVIDMVMNSDELGGFDAFRTTETYFEQATDWLGCCRSCCRGG